MKTVSCRARVGAGALAFAILMFSAATLMGDVPGRITTHAGRTVQGTIRYLPASRAYSVTDQSGVTVRVEAREVASVRVRKPENFDALVRQVAAGQYAAAAPGLQEIVTSYAMLEWDIPAAGQLAKAYLAMGDAGRAIIVCNDIIQQNPAAALSKDLAPTYWQALLKENRIPALRRQLEEAAQKGSREMAARAQVARGDIAVQEGNFKEALLDGYLRTVVLFRTVTEVQPEALYKSAKSFEELGQTSYAERMRKKLLEEFPRDKYAQELRSGT